MYIGIGFLYIYIHILSYIILLKKQPFFTGLKSEPKSDEIIETNIMNCLH